MSIKLSIVGYEMPSLKDIISNLILEEAGDFDVKRLELNNTKMSN